MRTPGSALVVALLISGSAFAASVQQQVEDSPVGVGDPFHLTVSVAGAGQDVSVELPPGDFQVLGRSRSTSVAMSAGPAGLATHRTEQFEFTLAATRPGRLVIPAARVVADGKELAGQPTPVDVQRGHVARAQAPDDEADPFASMMKQFNGLGASSLGRFFGGDPFAGEALGEPPQRLRPGDVRLEAVADRKTAWPGQQITVSYYLHTRVSLSSVTGLELPAFDGAATRDIELGKRLVPEQGDGEERVLIARKALFANAPGPLEIRRATARVAAGDGQELTVASAPLRLSIVPLPPGPANAAVGSWTLALEGPSRAAAGEPMTFRVTARGLGDISSLPPPAPAFPAAWKVFPPSTTETPGTSDGRVGGTRTWDFVAVAQGDGEATVPPVELAAFDPQTARYGTIQSEPLTVRVTKAAAPSGGEARPAQPVAPQGSWSRAAPTLLVVLAAAAVLALLLEARRRRARADAPRGSPLRSARSELEAARALCTSEQAPAFFATLARALHQLAVALGDPDASSEDPAAIAARLKLGGNPGPVCEALARAVEACRRFAFLRSSDGATLQRSLALADEAFGAAA